MEIADVYRYKSALERLRKISDIKLKKPLLIHTLTGDLRVLRSDEIGYFRYASSKKNWEIALTDGSFLKLKGNLRADNLCAYHSEFIQIHQSYIINLRYLHMIQNKHCILYPPFQMVEELQVSLKYRKEILTRFCLF